MNTKLMKIVMLIATVMILFSNSYVLAETDTNPITNPEYYRPGTDSENATENATTLISMVGGVLGVIQTVGIVCSVIVLCVIGLKYMLGSVEQKAEYKKTILGYIIGVALLVSATTIPNMLYKLGTSIGEETPTGSGGGNGVVQDRLDPNFSITAK